VGGGLKAGDVVGGGWLGVFAGGCVCTLPPPGILWKIPNLGRTFFSLKMGMSTQGK